MMILKIFTMLQRFSTFLPSSILYLFHPFIITLLFSITLTLSLSLCLPQRNLKKFRIIKNFSLREKSEISNHQKCFLSLMEKSVKTLSHRKNLKFNIIKNALFFSLSLSLSIIKKCKYICENENSCEFFL